MAVTKVFQKEDLGQFLVVHISSYNIQFRRTRYAYRQSIANSVDQKYLVQMCTNSIINAFMHEIKLGSSLKETRSFKTLPKPKSEIWNDEAMQRNV